MASWGGAAGTPINVISLIAAVPFNIGPMATATLTRPRSTGKEVRRDEGVEPNRA